MRVGFKGRVSGLWACGLVLAVAAGAWAKEPQIIINRDETAVKDAKADLVRAQKDYASTMTSKRNNFDRSAELKNAQLAVTTANSEVSKAREAVMATLGGDPDYQALSKKAFDAQAKVDALRGKQAPADQMSAASTDVMRVGSEVSAMDRKALDADPAYTTAMQKVADANKALTKMKSDFETSLTTDKELKDLKKHQEDCAVNVTKAQNKLDEDKKP